MLKNLSLNNCTIFPFAFNPENHKARKVTLEEKNEGVLFVHFDMTVEAPPECCAVAIILPEIHKRKKIRIVNTVIENESEYTPKFNVELKKGANKIKYFEKNIEDIDDFIEIAEETCEIVFTCWYNKNKNFKGTVCLNFYEESF